MLVTALYLSCIREKHAARGPPSRRHMGGGMLLLSRICQYIRGSLVVKFLNPESGQYLGASSEHDRESHPYMGRSILDVVSWGCSVSSLPSGCLLLVIYRGLNNYNRVCGVP